MRRGPYKLQCLRVLRDRGVPVATILDVGVLHSTPELMSIWPDRRHILFEPVAEHGQVIARSYRDIDHELHQVAVGDDDGVTALEVSQVIEGLEISHSRMVDTPPTAAHRTVARISLDSFLSRKAVDKPYLLKIDIDGHELRVLSGARATLRECSIVIVECDRSALAQRIQVVQSAGFTLFDLCEPCYYDKAFWQCDAVFLRSDLHRQYFKQLTGKVESGMYEAFRE